MADLDLPFEEDNTGTQLDLSDALVSGAVVVMAVVTNIGPALVFRFHKPDGTGFYPPILLAAPPSSLRNLPGLVYQATATAIRRANDN